ncbi:Cd2+/Zn2+-exporting ATPase [Granulicatella balaenopterae]|uniref:Cd(2+)-exporting ATPase n=1 Tax=Granulicatella balaenopterae TaxID=137733 RepID=A0A1H9PA49_9LACT|nr:Cd2+/Zn2+-exporting ATPase [Granulicatella balaenopterae]
MFKNKKTPLKLGSSLLCLLLGLLLPISTSIQILLFLLSYIIVAHDVLRKAILHIYYGQMLDENFLMAIASIAALSIGQFSEGIMVMWLYQVGEAFQSYAVNKSRNSISTLMNLYPDTANLVTSNGIEVVDPDDLAIGDIILVKPGEKIPVDGIVIEGTSLIDTAALTGESIPRAVKVSQEIYSGCINQDGLLKIEVTKELDDSMVTKIIELVEDAGDKKAKTENFITTFARYYTPLVVGAAVLLAIIPPLVSKDATFSDYLYRAASFLVISCPCALVISVPLGFFSGIGAASKLGILIKGSTYIEALAKINTIAFDKTGTLTKGNFKVTTIQSLTTNEHELLEYASYAEYYSNHPIACSIKKAFGEAIDEQRITNTKEIAGRGIKATIDHKTVFIGNHTLMKEQGLTVAIPEEVGTIVHVAVDHKYLGYLVICDQIKPESRQVIRDLKENCHLKDTVLLTGDQEKIAHYVAKELGIDQVYSELLPQEKVTQVEKLLLASDKDHTVAFVGDGINDAPVLTRCDIGISMGGLGSDAAIEASDIVIMDDDLKKIPLAISLCRRTMTIVKQNIIFVLAIKFGFLILGAFGISTMWEAVFADVGVSILAILNSMRALKFK